MSPSFVRSIRQAELAEFVLAHRSLRQIKRSGADDNRVGELIENVMLIVSGAPFFT